MNYGDFGGLVQLGIGLHIGTALFQLYGEIGVQPLERILRRVRELTAEPKAAHLAEELEDVETDFDVFKIQLFNEYRHYLVINSVVAVLLIAILIAITFAANAAIPAVVGVILVALSILPAGATLGSLWLDASRQIQPIKRKAEELQTKALRLHGRS
jgi:hypothetical protein